MGRKHTHTLAQQSSVMPSLRQWMNHTFEERNSVHRHRDAPPSSAPLRTHAPPQGPRCTGFGTGTSLPSNVAALRTKNPLATVVVLRFSPCGATIRILWSRDGRGRSGCDVHEPRGLRRNRHRHQHQHRIASFSTGSTAVDCCVLCCHLSDTTKTVACSCRSSHRTIQGTPIIITACIFALRTHY